MAYLCPEKALPLVEYCPEKSSQSRSVVYSSFWNILMIDCVLDNLRSAGALVSCPIAVSPCLNWSLISLKFCLNFTRSSLVLDIPMSYRLYPRCRLLSI